MATHLVGGLRPGKEHVHQAIFTSGLSLGRSLTRRAVHSLCDVFSFLRKPVRHVNTKAWRATLKRVGIEDFRWHDLRHTWTSWHVQAGTPLHALQELGGWECVEMVRNYAHLASDHLVQYADRMSGLRPMHDGEVATIGLRATK